MIGQTLDGRYRLLSLLGEGGMGKVFLAEHVVLEKRFAVKVLHEEYSRQEELMKRFQQEAIAASRIGQENIVNVTDFGRTAEGALYFVMEELQGQSLSTLIRDYGAILAERALPIFAQICRALAAAHARGIIHRDLKPENVMLVQREDRADFVKVLDFGISKVGGGSATEPKKTKLTRMGVIMGTPDYMAPEQASGGVVDQRADVYAFGVLAYEMLTGTLPFRGETAMAVLLKHQTEIPEPLSARRTDIPFPAGLEALVLKALSKAPDARQSSVIELAKELALVAKDAGLPLISGIPSHEHAAATRGLSPGAPATPSPAPSRPSTVGEPDPFERRTPSGTLQLPPVAQAAPVPVPVPLVQLAPADAQAPDRARKPAREPARIGELQPDELAAVRTRGLPRWVWVAAPLLVAAGAVAAVVSQRPAPPAPTPTVTQPAPPMAASTTVPTPAPVITPAVNPTVPPPPAPTLQTVSLRSLPPGATVWDGKKPLGVTPLDVQLAPSDTPTYKFVLAGYRAVSRKISAADDHVQVQLPKVKARGDGFEAPQDLKANPFGR